MDNTKTKTLNKFVIDSQMMDRVIGQKANLQEYLPKLKAKRTKILAKKPLISSRTTHLPKIDQRFIKKSSTLLSKSLVKSIDTKTDLSISSSLSIRASKCLVDAHLKLPSIQNHIATTEDISQLTGGDVNKPLPSTESSVGRSSLHIVNNWKLVCLDSNIEKLENDIQDSLNEFYHIFIDIEMFNIVNECIDFIRKYADQRIFLIVSNELATSIIPYIHDLQQLDSIYILCKKVSKRKKRINQLFKVKNKYTDINAIYETIIDIDRTTRRNSLVISETSIDLDRLDPSFMYTKLIKEILLDMPYDSKSKMEFAEFCRQKYYNNKTNTYLHVIDEFERDYQKHTSIWWYTRDCFISNLVNQAFRLLEIDIVIKIGFFVYDLHKRIEELHEQPVRKLIFYRGQGLPHSDFAQLKRRKNCLYSFHTFISTSTDKQVAIAFAESSQNDSELTGVIFKIIVNPTTITSIRFASLHGVTIFSEENETLFSMHSVFRIGTITLRKDNLWEVELTLTSDDDKDLKKITENIREGTQGATGWDRLGKLLLHMRNFNKAEEVFQTLIKNASDNDMEKCGYRYHMIGIIKKYQDAPDEALNFFYKALEMYENSRNDNHLHLITIHNDIGSIYHHKKEYENALEFYKIALNKQENCSPRNDSDLQITYGNIAEVNKNLDDYSNALKFYQKKLAIHKKSDPLKYLDLAITYDNIGEMYYHLESYKEALRYFRKVSTIRRHQVNDNTKLALSLNKVSQVYEKMGNYLQAIEQCECARNILIKLNPIDYSELAKICKQIAELYEKTKAFSVALSFYQETLRYLERSLNPVKTNLAKIHHNIGQMYEKIGDFERAFYEYRNAIRLEQNTSSSNYSQFQLYQQHFQNLKTKYNFI